MVSVLIFDSNDLSLKSTQIYKKRPRLAHALKTQDWLKWSFFRAFRRDYLGLVLVHILSNNDPAQTFAAEIIVAALNDLVHVRPACQPTSLPARILIRRWPNQCDQNFATFVKIKKSWAILGRIIWYLGEILNLFWQTSCVIGHILIVSNDQILKKPILPSGHTEPNLQYSTMRYKLRDDRLIWLFKLLSLWPHCCYEPTYDQLAWNHDRLFMDFALPYRLREQECLPLNKSSITFCASKSWIYPCSYQGRDSNSQPQVLTITSLLMKPLV